MASISSERFIPASRIDSSGASTIPSCAPIVSSDTSSCAPNPTARSDRATLVKSPSIALAQNRSRIAARQSDGSSPTIPKSSIAIRPSSSTHRLPACTSAWNRPCTVTASSHTLTTLRTNSIRSAEWNRTGATRSIGPPYTRSMQIIRGPHQRQ